MDGDATSSLPTCSSKYRRDESLCGLPLLFVGRGPVDCVLTTVSVYFMVRLRLYPWFAMGSRTYVEYLRWTLFCVSTYVLY